MGKHYSLDFRQQVLKIYNSGDSIVNIIKVYGISRRTLFYWLKRDNENNLLPCTRGRGIAYKISKIKIEQLLQDADNNITLKELAKNLNVAVSTIYYYFCRNKITFKKKTYGIKKVIKN